MSRLGVKIKINTHTRTKKRRKETRKKEKNKRRKRKKEKKIKTMVPGRETNNTERLFIKGYKYVPVPEVGWTPRDKQAHDKKKGKQLKD